MSSEPRVPLIGAETASAVAATRTAASTPATRASSPAGWLMRALLRLMGDPAIRVVLWNGERIDPVDAEPVATVRIEDRRTLLRLVYHPELEFGEAYTDGRLQVDGDLVGLLETAFGTPMSPWAERFLCRSRRPRANTLRGSRANIHHHYDLGNDFYRIWLDERLLYTCAYFPTPTASLEAAQVAKMELVCRKVGLQPGARVVEAGCGWGALALYMARNHGVSVRAFNISHEQIAYARGQAGAEGLSDRVEFIEDDYRNVSGQYDAFVSVGMLEHVGADHYRELGRIIDRCLPAHGRGFIHTIGRNRPLPFNTWTEKRIFPGAYPPTLREMMTILEPYGFSVLDVENLRLHYATTLRHWLGRFEHAADRVAAMFDERFVRAWRLYLAGSVAAFSTGSLQLFQLSFARSRHNAIPWTRAHLYA
ncbi:MAG TPA: cyclopropane-fatty-acyl-phospholipid synthase family protein [Candidatus Acidoferrales bacterium]|nr:cyclopropane-fatty-acyl-phospholipid synthase family protein [Candidatus Acidoferrales bacterium]